MRGESQGPRMAVLVGTIQGINIYVRDKVMGFIYLPVTPASLEMRRKCLIYFESGPIHGSFLNSLTCNIYVVINQDAKNFLRNNRLIQVKLVWGVELYIGPYLSEADLGQENAEVAGEVASEWLLAGDLSQASGKLLAHESTSLTKFFFVTRISRG